MIKKTLADKKMTKQEIASQVKNASSATERAKMLLKQGKLQINATKRYHFYSTISLKSWVVENLNRKLSNDLHPDCEYNDFFSLNFEFTHIDCFP